MDVFLQMVFAGLTIGSVYSLLGVGYNLIFNSCRVVNFSQGEFFTLGAMMVITLTVSSAHLPLALGMVLSILVAIIVALLLERLFFRRALSFSPMIAVGATFGFIFLLEGVYLLVWGGEPRLLPTFLGGGGHVEIGGASFSVQALWALAAVTVVCLALWLYFYRTRAGKAMRAAAENRDAALLMGIDAPGMVRISFILAGTVGALAGIFLAPITYVSYNSGALLTMKGFAACVLGGVGSVFGSFAGGFLLGIMEAMTAGYYSSEYKDAVVFGLLIVILLFRPTGLFGKAWSE